MWSRIFLAVVFSPQVAHCPLANAGPGARPPYKCGAAGGSPSPQRAPVWLHANRPGAAAAGAPGARPPMLAFPPTLPPVDCNEHIQV